MRWWPGECKAGDIIRIPLGQIHHYGVYVADDEIIQFGEPPVQTLNRNEKEIRVCVTDINSFSCGQIIEIGEPEKGDSFRRVDRNKAIRAARSRIGEDGYSLLHNNCEHFAYECVFGVKYCEQEARTREKWLNRPVLDIYVAPVSAFGQDEDTAAEKMLEYALKRSLNLTPGAKPRGEGSACHAICRADGIMAAAVSRKPVGIAIGSAKTAFPKDAKQLLYPGEMMPDEPDRMALYLKKRCLFDEGKKTLFRRFDPRKTDSRGRQALVLDLNEGKPLLLVCTGEQLANAHVRICREGEWQLIPTEGAVK